MYFQEIEEALLNIHTAFIGIVVGMNGEDKAKVQPLNLIKQYGEKPQKQAVLTDVPILEHVRHIELYETEIDGGAHSQYTGSGVHTHGTHGGHVRLKPLEAGDIVFCVCSDRDITQTKKGKSALPALGHHEIKDAVIVGCL